MNLYNVHATPIIRIHEPDTEKEPSPPLEHLKGNIFSINDPELLGLFAEIESSLRIKDLEGVDRLCRKLKGLLKQAALGENKAQADLSKEEGGCRGTPS